MKRTTLLLLSLLALGGCVNRAEGADLAVSALAPAQLDDDPIADAIGTSPSDPSADPGGFLAAMGAAAKAGQWRLLAAGILMVLVWLARRFGSSVWPWLGTDRGGAALVLAVSLFGGLATALAGTASLSWGFIGDTLAMAFTSAGGYAVLRKLFAPSDAK